MKWKEHFPSEETFHAWCGGFFDGEGCIYVSRNKAKGSAAFDGYTRALTVSISQINVEPLIPIEDKFGGTIRMYKQDTSVAGRARAIKTNIFKWAATGPTAVAFLREIYPYSLHKKEQVRIAMEWKALEKGRKIGQAMTDQDHWDRERIRILLLEERACQKIHSMSGRWPLEYYL